MRKRVGKTRHGKEGGEVVHLVACQLYLALGYRTCSDIVVDVDDKVQFIQYIHNGCVGDLTNITSQMDSEQLAYHIKMKCFRL